MKKFGILIIFLVFFVPVFSNADSCSPIWPATTCDVIDTVTISASVNTDPNIQHATQYGSIVENLLPPASISFSGIAFPYANLYVLKDGQSFLKTTAYNNSNFYMINPSINPGIYVFSVFVESYDGIKYKIGTWTIEITKGMKVEISNIMIPQFIWDLLFNIKIPDTLPKPYICGSIPADFNCDRNVDLSDLSILHYYYKLNNFVAKYDINKDSKIELGDFSVLAYYWTG